MIKTTLAVIIYLSLVTGAFAETITKRELLEEPHMSLVDSEGQRLLEGSFSTHPFYLPDGDFGGYGGVLLQKTEKEGQDLMFLFSKDVPDTLVGAKFWLSGKSNRFIDFVIALNRALGEKVYNYRVENGNRAVQFTVQFDPPITLKPVIDDILHEAQKVQLSIDHDQNERSASALAIFGLPGSNKKYQIKIDLF